VNKQAVFMLVGLLLMGSVLGTSSAFEPAVIISDKATSYTYQLSSEDLFSYPAGYLTQADNTTWRVH
jgi:hypothetical protein